MKRQTTRFSEISIRKDILREAKMLNLSNAVAEVYAEKTAQKVAAWAEKRSVITREDLARVTARELAKYSPDLVYVYKNRDKII